MPIHHFATIDVNVWNYTIHNRRNLHDRVSRKTKIGFDLNYGLITGKLQYLENACKVCTLIPWPLIISSAPLFFSKQTRRLSLTHMYPFIEQDTKKNMCFLFLLSNDA